MNRLVLLLVVACGCGVAFAGASSVGHGMPVIDGKLDDACWANAEFHSDFQFIKNFDDGSARKPTEFAIACDEATVYFAFRCGEPDMAELRSRADTGLWSECVEMHFAPDNASFEFYQFAIGPATKDVYAQFLSEGGVIRPDPFRPVWKQAIQFSEREWTAEVAIPFSALYMTPNSKWQTTWRCNVVRTTKTGGKAAMDYTWSPLERKAFEPRNFRSVSGFPQRAAEEDVCVRNVIAKMNGRDTGGIHGEQTVTIHAGLTGKYEIETSSGAKLEIALNAGLNEVKLPCVYRDNGRSWTHFRVTRKGFARSCERDYPVMVDFEPIRVRLTKPGYRNNFYPGQDVSSVEGKVEIAGGATAELTLEGPGFAMRKTTVTGKGAFKFDTTGFTHGDATLAIVAGGERKTLRIRNLPPTGHRMTWVENGNLIVNGKPVIRRTIDAINYRQGRQNYERFQKERASFRMTEDLHNEYIEARSFIKGIERSEGCRDVKPSDEVFRTIDKKLASMKGKDYACWFIVDEPECRNVSPVWLKYQYDYLAEKDPYHVISTDSRAGKKYLDCVDVVQTHPYLAAVNCEDGTRRYGVPPCDIGSYVDAFGASERPDKVVGIIPTCFAYRWHSTRNDYPTLEEYLCCAWAAIVRGAKSIRPYAAHDMGDRAQLWEGTRYLFECAEALEDFLLFAKRTTLTKSKETETTLYELGQERMIVAINFTKEPKVASFPKLSGLFLEFRGPRTFELSNSFPELKPFEVVIATSSKRDAKLEPYSAMAKRVAESEAERLSHDSQILERQFDVVTTSNMEAYGGRFYKLIDGCRDMWAVQSVGKALPYIEMSFPHFTPVFDKIRIYGGAGLKRVKVATRRSGEWVTLVPTGKMVGKWMYELAFDEPVRATALRFTFPLSGKDNKVEIYEIELPKCGSAPVVPDASELAAASIREDEGVIAEFGKNTKITENANWDLADDMQPEWAVIDFASFVPKAPRKYKAWHVRMETPDKAKNQLLASLGGEPEEAGVYAIRLDPIPECGRKWIALRDYGLDIGFNGLTLLERPANRIELDVPKGATEVHVGDEVAIRIEFAMPCEDVSAEFVYAFKALEPLRPYAVNGASGIKLRRLDDNGYSWGANVRIESLPADVPKRCVYVRAQALGGGFPRPLFGNFSVPFKR